MTVFVVFVVLARNSACVCVFVFVCRLCVLIDEVRGRQRCGDVLDVRVSMQACVTGCLRLFVFCSAYVLSLCVGSACLRR